MNYEQLQALAKADAGNMTVEQRRPALNAAKNAGAGMAWQVTLTVLDAQGANVERTIPGTEWAAYYVAFANGIV